MASSTGPESEILSVLNKFNGFLSKKPPSVVEARKLVLDGSFAILSARNGLDQTTLGELIKREESRKNDIQLRLHDVPQKMWIYEDIAALWAEHGGKETESSEGEDGITGAEMRLYGFARTNDGWKISGVAGTYKDPSLESLSEPTPALMEPVDALLSNFSHPDWDTLKDWFVPGAGCTLYRPPMEPMPMTMHQSIVRLQDMVKSGSTIQEKIQNVEARIHGDLGFVWAPFVVEIDGVPRHEGVNIFSFLNRSGKWRFSGCQDFGRAMSAGAS
ncbi:hypothetical protein QQS21_011606 [Conoideocrella luteorostrata]|uniref:SnoaL-like domain-containing protein n=1 Tax=Conoideocrella luteorostrata TaxID=1105319 RepID=A0AAJ0FNF4_9HYPO|nr:hypothetical protein QQS21_011606 [Conoideocrella luteorostrata]